MFITNLIICPYKENKWELMDSLVFHYNGISYIVPRGFITDLATIPRALWSIYPPFFSSYARASTLHDYLLTKINRDRADELFKIALESEKVDPKLIKEFYNAVRLNSYRHKIILWIIRLLNEMKLNILGT